MFASGAVSEFLCIIWITTRWRSWLRHCATSRKVAVSSFRWYNSSGRSGVDSAYNRSEYQEYFLGDKGGRCVGLTILPPSSADCLEIWELVPSGNPWAWQRVYRDCFTFDMDKRSLSNGYWSKKIELKYSQILVFMLEYDAAPTFTTTNIIPSPILI